MPSSQRTVAISFSILLAAATSSPSEAATYYVSPSGSDKAPGTSEKQAWKSMERANQGVYRAGDSILFEGGKAFKGVLLLHADNSHGKPEKPVTIGSYGNGRAILQGDPASGGVFAAGVGGIAIRNISLAGSAPASGGSGIAVMQEKAGTVSGIQISDVEISGFTHAVFMSAGDIPAKISDVRIERVSAHDNAMGLGFYGHSSIPAISSGGDYAISDVFVSHCQLFRNTGAGVSNLGAGAVMMNVSNIVPARIPESLRLSFQKIHPARCRSIVQTALIGNARTGRSP